MSSAAIAEIMYKIDDDYYMRPLSLDDLNGPYMNWFLDQEICRYSSHGKYPKNKSEFENYILNSNNQNRIVLAIIHIKDGHIGNVTLQNMSAINRNAEFAIIVGNPKHHGKGVALKASCVLMKHGFNKLNLERIYCGTAQKNIGMVKLAKRLGMKQEGCRRKHLFLEGEWQDMLEFGVLNDEFLEISNI